MFGGRPRRVEQPRRVPARLAIPYLLCRELGEERVQLRVRLALGTRRRGENHGHARRRTRAVTRTARSVRAISDRRRQKTRARTGAGRFWSGRADRVDPESRASRQTSGRAPGRSRMLEVRRLDAAGVRTHVDEVRALLPFPRPPRESDVRSHLVLLLLSLPRRCAGSTRCASPRRRPRRPDPNPTTPSGTDSPPATTRTTSGGSSSSTMPRPPPRRLPSQSSGSPRRRDTPRASTACTSRSTPRIAAAATARGSCVRSRRGPSRVDRRSSHRGGVARAPPPILPGSGAGPTTGVAGAGAARRLSCARATSTENRATNSTRTRKGRDGGGKRRRDRDERRRGSSPTRPGDLRALVRAAADGRTTYSTA